MNVEHRTSNIERRMEVNALPVQHACSFRQLTSFFRTSAFGVGCWMFDVLSHQAVAGGFPEH